MSPHIDHDAQKQAIKEALKEWMDERFAALGRWTFNGLAVAAFTAAVYFIMISQGWKK